MSLNRPIFNHGVHQNLVSLPLSHPVGQHNRDRADSCSRRRRDVESLSAYFQRPMGCNYLRQWEIRGSRQHRE